MKISSSVLAYTTVLSYLSSTMATGYGGAPAVNYADPVKYGAPVKYDAPVQYAAPGYRSGYEVDYGKHSKKGSKSKKGGESSDDGAEGQSAEDILGHFLRFETGEDWFNPISGGTPSEGKKSKDKKGKKI